MLVKRLYLYKFYAIIYNMDKFPRNTEPTAAVSEQRNVDLNRDDILDLHHDLLEASEYLHAFAIPERHERTAIRIPLDNERLSHLTAGKWHFYTSLSAAYLQDGGNEQLAMTFTTPQVWDSIDIRLAMPDCWNVTPHDMSRPVTTFSNWQLLQLLDSKIKHNTSTINLLRRMPSMTEDEFPAAIMDMLEPLAKITTEVQTYSASDYIISSGKAEDSTKQSMPEYMSRSTAEIVRADGVKAIDYIIRLGFDGLPVQSDHTEPVNTPTFSNIANTYEHRFSVSHETGLTTDTQTIFSATSDNPQDTEKLRRYIQSNRPELRGGDVFRHAIRMVADEYFRLPDNS